MTGVCRVALREWASVCTELASGRATLVLRKGGIAERPAGGFTASHSEFFLFPSHFHERPEDLEHGVGAGSATSPPAPEGTVELLLHASVAAFAEISDLEAARALVPYQPLTRDAVERRFRYRKPGITALVLRVHRLAAPLVIPNLARYDVCRSWVALEGELAFECAAPVLDEATFAARLSGIRATLGTG